MKAFVSIQDFGTDDQKRDLCENIALIAHFPASVTEAGVVLVTCSATDLGALFIALAANTATDWIEYTVQFDH